MMMSNEVIDMMASDDWGLIDEYDLCADVEQSSDLDTYLDYYLGGEEQSDKLLHVIRISPYRYVNQVGYLSGDWFRKDISQIGAEDVEKLVTVEAQVKNVSKRREYKYHIEFECRSCSHRIYEKQDLIGKDIDKPEPCVECDSTSWEVVEADSVMRREVLLQQIQSDHRDQIRLVLDADLSNKVQAGDRIRVNAVVLREDEDDAYSDLCLYCVGLEKEDELDLEVSKEDKEEFEEVAEENDMMEYLEDSVAPSLVGDEYSEVRKGVLLQLLSGGFGSKIRDESNILLAGDPGTGKSEVLKWASEISKNGQFTSENSTGVGLVGTVEQVEQFDSSEWSIRAGAIPKASGGLCAIDEMDKLGKNDVQKLHTALSQDKISLNKASKSVSLDADTSILAAANPSQGSIQSGMDVLEQLDFESTILSRFDLVFILRDNGRSEDDVQEIIENRRELEVENQGKEWVSKYIEYAKEEYFTTMTEEADEALRKAFCQLGSDDLNPRYLDALERLARSHARLNLRDEVTAEDVEVAYELIKESFSQLGLDDESENIDLQKIESGISQKEQELLAEIGDKRSLMSLKKEMNGELESMLKELEEAGLVYVNEDDDLVSTL